MGVVGFNIVGWEPVGKPSSVDPTTFAGVDDPILAVLNRNESRLCVVNRNLSTIELVHRNDSAIVLSKTF